MTENEGIRIWEIDEKTRVPKEIYSEKDSVRKYIPPMVKLRFKLNELDLDNKTYAIRIGKEGLR